MCCFLGMNTEHVQYFSNKAKESLKGSESIFLDQLDLSPTFEVSCLAATRTYKADSSAVRHDISSHVSHNQPEEWSPSDAPTSPKHGLASGMDSLAAGFLFCPPSLTTGPARCLLRWCTQGHRSNSMTLVWHCAFHIWRFKQRNVQAYAGSDLCRQKPHL